MESSLDCPDEELIYCPMHCVLVRVRRGRAQNCKFTTDGLQVFEYRYPGKSPRLIKSFKSDTRCF